MAQSTCSIEGCGKPAKNRGWCSAHYTRWRRHGDPLAGAASRKRPIRLCSVEGCDRVVDALGLCAVHYLRFKRNGETGSAEIASKVRHAPGQMCSVDGCDSLAKLRGWCAGHYQRWLLKGDPGPAEFKYQGSGDDIGYFAAHDRVRKVKGSARDQTCAHCGAPARDWAYDHADPDERTAPEDDPHAAGMPYSVNIDSYIPLCKACHNKFDRPD